MPRRRRLPAVRQETLSAPPGTLVAPEHGHPTELEVMAWGPESLASPDTLALDALPALRAEHELIWVNVVGLQDVAVLEELGRLFGLHRLALEDVVNIPQRPKIDHYGDHEYLVARMPVSKSQLETEQLSIFLAEGLVITVQERPGDCFEGIRRRVRDGRKRIRGGGSGYLAYAIVDALVDAYLPLIESIAEGLDEMELAIIDHAESGQITALHDTKRDLVTLRRYLAPLRDMIEVLIADDTDLLDEDVRVHMRDCLDHCKHALDLVESHRSHAGNIMDLHLSVSGQRMNEVMKVLTVIATLFIPLSFIAGLYGMNFDTASPWNLPELGWTFGYPYALGLMVACAGAMLVYFWKKGWFR